MLKIMRLKPGWCIAVALFFSLVVLGGKLDAAEKWWRYPIKCCTKEKMEQAGWANYVRKNAQWTYDEKYTGYYIGGGAVGTKYGRCRCPQQGTFGVDYNPRFTKVTLLWSHGFRYQDGRGAYESDHKNRPFKNLHQFGSNEAH